MKKVFVYIQKCTPCWEFSDKNSTCRITDWENYLMPYKLSYVNIDRIQEVVVMIISRQKVRYILEKSPLFFVTCL